MDWTIFQFLLPAIAATLIIAANTGPARAAEPHRAGPVHEAGWATLGRPE